MQWSIQTVSLTAFRERVGVTRICCEKKKKKSSLNVAGPIPGPTNIKRDKGNGD